jgi:Flp pilus assembly protein TadD
MAMRLLAAALALGGALQAARVSIAPGDSAKWAGQGRRWFGECEFKKAARAFELAVEASPGDASLHHWLGKSYARMAEVASPLHAPRDARRARRSLARAVALDPGNEQYARELFDLYLNSPEWFRGGLREAAALLDKTAPALGSDPAGEGPERARLEAARQEYRGPSWWIRQMVVGPSEELSRIVP